jgi:sarcosine oxidase subunit beta
MRVSIVGAGVVGSAVAWHLATAGHDVVVLEAKTVASGASGGPGERGVRANGRDRRELPLAKRAHEIWPALHDELGAPTGFRRIGGLQLIERDEDLAPAEAMVERQIAAGIDCGIVHGEELREIEPGLSSLVIAAIRCPVDGVADHTATTTAFANAARRAGAELVDGQHVHTLDDERLTSGEAVLIAANAGARQLLATGGVDLPTFNVHPQVIMTRPLDRVVVPHLIGHAHRPLAIKMLPDGAVMITGGRLGKDGVVDADEVARTLSDAAAVFPALQTVEVDSATCDRAESVARDLIPIVDRVPGLANAFVAAGWSGHGWAIAPAVAEALGGWMTTGDRPDVLHQFRLGRDIS